jgi:hypothetical protein
MKMDVSDLTNQSSLVVRCEWFENKTDTRAKMFDFVEMPVTNILLTRKDIPGSSTEVARQGNRAFVLEQYNVLQQVIVLVQSAVTFSNLDKKKQAKIKSQMLTRILSESMVFSHPCSSIVCCNVSPNPSSLPQNLTAIQYLNQIRNHVMHKV